MKKTIYNSTDTDRSFQMENEEIKTMYIYIYEGLSLRYALFRVVNILKNTIFDWIINGLTKCRDSLCRWAIIFSASHMLF